LNLNVKNHLAVLGGAENSLGALESQSLGKADSSERLQNVIKNIKMVKFLCSKTVASESERIIPLQTHPQSAAKGAVTTIDVVEGCSLVCKVSVRGRRAPLKINIAYMKGGK
jgi:hypothetical protein